MTRLTRRLPTLSLLVLVSALGAAALEPAVAAGASLRAQDPGETPDEDADEAPVRDAERYAGWVSASLELLRGRYDADGDGVVVREEYPGDDKYWRRLDRDKDKQLTAADWELEPREKIPREPIRAPKVKGFGPQVQMSRIQIEGGVPFPFLRPDEVDDGRVRSVRLDAMLKDRPAVLFFANSTAPGARKLAPEMKRIAATYPGVRFLLLYGPERHAVDGLRGMPDGDVPMVEEPRTFEERAVLARAFVKEFGLEDYHVMVDNLDNLPTRLYRGERGRVYVLSRARIINQRSAPGHREVDLRAIENDLRVKLNMDLLEEE